MATTKVDVNLIDASGITSSKYLKGDGTWGTVDALPSQTSQSGKFLTTDGSDASWGTVADGLSYAQQWQLTADLSIDNTDNVLYANWALPDADDSAGSIGSDMSVDSASSGDLSGAWTFPDTGVWYVAWRCQTHANTANHDFTPKLWTTTDTGSNWQLAASAMRLNRANYTQPNLVDYIVNISNVTTHKVRVSGIVSLNVSVIKGDDYQGKCVMTFIKLGD